MHYQLLVVDDNSDFTDLIDLALQPLVQEGQFSLLFARDGVEALDLIAHHPSIELVITDISMPQMDGLTLLERINTYNPHIKCIVISGHNDLRYIRRAMNAGASDYLVKPVSLDDLHDAIVKAAKRVDIVREALKSRDTLKVYERELKIAYDIQQEMLPRKFPAFPDRTDFDIDGGMLPARHVGGDFYDFFLVDDNTLGFVVGDVSGKGISAALLMAQIRTLLRSFVLQGKSVNETMHLINNAIAEENKQAMFATAFLAFLDLSTGTIEYCNAAHVAPLIVHLNGSVSECVPTENMAIGMIAAMPYTTKSVNLLSGESIVIVTDGITESTSRSGEMFGHDRLYEILRGQAHHPTHEIMMSVIESVNKFSVGAEQYDDIGILVVKFLGTQE